MRKLTTALAVVGLLIALVAGAASAAPGGADRPYKATGTGVIAINPQAGTVSFTNVENATHLGRATNEASGPFSPTGPTTFTVNNVAANGDVLSQTLVSTTTSTSPTGFTLVNTITFHGGTGRFVDAQGTATGYVTAVADPAVPGLFHTTYTVKGTISY